MNDVVVMTDSSSSEGSRTALTRAVHLLTRRPPRVLDARHFYEGGGGRISWDGAQPVLEVPRSGIRIRPAVLIIYEIPPGDRPRLRRFQQAIRHSDLACLGADPTAWRHATDKQCTVERLRSMGVPQMESVVLQRPDDGTAVAAFERLGRDVWTRPAVGLGGRDVFHITDIEQLQRAVARYAVAGEKFLLTRDAGNFDPWGRRHQYRVVVLGDRILRVCEHVQPVPDMPCNEAQGARSTLMPPRALPRALAELAIEATGALGLPFGGVDLAAENGGVIFEVNVHPVLTGDRGFETVTVPFVRAHLDDRAALAAPGRNGAVEAQVANEADR